MAPENLKEIGGIGFSILSPSEVRKYSVTEITAPETYDEDGMPVQGGLMDNRLGTLEPGQKCATCGNTALRCPGHFGHIELAEPVLHIAFAEEVNKLLHSFCRVCGRFKMLPEEVEAYKDNHQIDEKIISGLYDDLNTPKVIAELNILNNELANANAKTKSKIKYNLLEIGKIFGILQENPDKWLGYGKAGNIDETDIERLIKERNEARGNKNFEVADKIRDQLKNKGIEIEDTAGGTIWRNIK